jgi:hypothetical protein
MVKSYENNFKTEKLRIKFDQISLRNYNLKQRI